MKCGCFHSSTAKALVPACSKEISNESRREPQKTIVMMNHSVLRAKRIGQISLVRTSKFILQCQHKIKHQSKVGVTGENHNKNHYGK